MECSVCSMLNFIGVALYNLIVWALQYPILTFIISVFIGFVIISNVHTAHMICNYDRNHANNALPAPTVPTNTVATSLTSFNPQPPSSKAIVRPVTNFDYGIEHGESTPHLTAVSLLSSVSFIVLNDSHATCILLKRSSYLEFREYQSVPD